MTRPFEQIIANLSALAIGTVESVSPEEIRVLLDLEAPQSTALNTGVPSACACCGVGATAERSAVRCGLSRNRCGPRSGRR